MSCNLSKYGNVTYLYVDCKCVYCVRNDFKILLRILKKMYFLYDLDGTLCYTDDAYKAAFIDMGFTEKDSVCTQEPRFV